MSGPIERFKIAQEQLQEELETCTTQAELGVHCPEIARRMSDVGGEIITALDGINPEAVKGLLGACDVFAAEWNSLSGEELAAFHEFRELIEAADYLAEAIAAARTEEVKGCQTTTQP